MKKLLLFLSILFGVQQLNAQLAVTISQTNISCNSVCDGSATAVPSGGTPPYTYVWAPNGNLSATSTGLCVGAYTVTVTDALANVATATTTILQPPVLLISGATTNISCNAMCDGAISVSVSGGTPPYTYLWNNSIPFSTASSLCAGTYTCTVTDANACTVTGVYVVTQPAVVPVVISPSNPTICSGSSITLSATGALAYTWTPGNLTTASITITPTVTTTYTVSGMDGNGCYGNATTTVIVNPIPSAPTASSNSPLCAGSTLNLTMSNIAGATYSWTGPNAFSSAVQNPSIILATAATAGTYSVTATVAGCTGPAGTTTVTVNPVSVGGSVSSTDTVCSGSNGDTLNLIGQIGSVVYWEYSSDGGLTWINISNTTTSQSYLNLTITTLYKALVQSGVCALAYSTPANIMVNPSPTVNFITIPATCAQANGELSVLPSGGVAPYSFLWSNSSTNDTLINLAAGIYSVTVTDANGCFNNGASAVNNATGPVINFTGVVNPTCYGGTNGTATANVTGNAPPYLYSWTTFPVQTTATANGLTAGNYFCTVSDTNNCQSSSSVTLTQPPQFYLGAQVLSIANCQNNGSARAWASGGIPPYNFLWSNSMTGDTVTGLTSGNFTVTATDNAGCSSIGNITVSSINAALVRGKIYSDMNANCIFDAGDFPIPNQSVYNYSALYYTTTDANGDYQLFLNGTGTQTISTSYNWLSPYTTGYCPATNSTTINIAALCDTVSNIDFSRTLTPGIQDLRINMVMPQNPRSGFPNFVYLYYYNVGTVTVPNTTVNLAFDSILSFISSTQTPSINNQAYLEWNTGTLAPGQNGQIHVVLQVPTIQNGGWIGRPLYYLTEINPVAGDQTPFDNFDVEHRFIVSSWDPNEKTCGAIGIDSLGNITPNDSILSYTIHFQNTGTDTAYNIYLIDTLSSYLNPATVTPSGASHPFTFEMYGNGIMKFNFYNIMLPDSNHNEPLSNGFVKYKVKVRPGLPLGTTIDNTASIYFDFNPAVVTNTTSNTIMWGGGLGVPENNPENISAFPNPFDESITLSLPENLKTKICDITLTDVQGRIVRTQKSQNTNSILIHRGQLEAGIYFCTVRSEGEMIGNKKLIIK